VSLSFYCAISLCVIVISLCHLTVCHCHFTVPSHCVVIAISLCHFTVPSHCVVIVISLCVVVISLCHLTVSSVSSHCVVIVISLCRHSCQHSRPDNKTNITQITSLLSGTAVAGMASNLSYVLSWRAHSVGLLLHK